MQKKDFSVLDLLELDLQKNNSLELNCVAGQKALSNLIGFPDINRPGLALSGFFDSFANERIQIFGMGENAYLNKILENGGTENIEKLFSYKMPCCIFTHGVNPPKEFLEAKKKYECPILKSDLPTGDLVLRLLRVLSNVFAPKISMHGVLIEVFGLGILITGSSGVGKSETALALIERGHRLVVDDIVEISCINGTSLIGKGVNKRVGHHMEIRGLGIIDIRSLFGVSAVREEKKIELVVKLEDWDPKKLYDRLGMEENTMEILNVKIPLIEMPIKPGRNIPIILETAVKNERLKQMGYFTAREFSRNVLKWIETDAETTPYYSTENDNY